MHEIPQAANSTLPNAERILGKHSRLEKLNPTNYENTKSKYFEKKDDDDLETLASADDIAEDIDLDLIDPAAEKPKTIELFAGSKKQEIFKNSDKISYEIEENHEKAKITVKLANKSGVIQSYELTGKATKPDSKNEAKFKIGAEVFDLEGINTFKESVIEDNHDIRIEQKTLATGGKKTLAGLNKLVTLLHKKEQFNKIGQIKEPGSVFAKLLGFPEAAAFKDWKTRTKLILQRLFDPYCAISDRVVVKMEQDANGKLKLINGKPIPVLDKYGDPVTEISKKAAPVRILKHLAIIGAGIGALAIAATIFSSSLGILLAATPIGWLIGIGLAILIFPGITRFLYRTGVIPALLLTFLSGNPLVLGVAAIIIVSAITFSLLYASALNKSGQLSLEGKNRSAFAMLVLAWILSVPTALTNGIIGLFTRSTFMDRIDVMASLNETKSKRGKVALFFFFRIFPSALKNGPKAFLIVFTVALLPLLAAPSGLAFVILAPQQSGMINLSLTILQYYSAFLGPAFGMQLSAGSLINLIMSSSLPLSTIYGLAGLATVWFSWPIVAAGFRFVNLIADVARKRTFKYTPLYQTMNMSNFEYATTTDYLSAIFQGSLKNGVDFFKEKLSKLIVKDLVADKLEELSESEEVNGILDTKGEVIKDIRAKDLADFKYAAHMYEILLRSEKRIKNMDKTVRNLRHFISEINPNLCLEIINRIERKPEFDNEVRQQKLKALFASEKIAAESINYQHLSAVAQELENAVRKYWYTDPENENNVKEQIEIIAESFYALGKFGDFKAYIDKFNEHYSTKLRAVGRQANFIYDKNAPFSREKLLDMYARFENMPPQLKPARVNLEAKLLVQNCRYVNNKLHASMMEFRTLLNKSDRVKTCLMAAEQAGNANIFKRAWQKLSQTIFSGTWWTTGEVKFESAKSKELNKDAHDANKKMLILRAEALAIDNIFTDPNHIFHNSKQVISEKIKSRFQAMFPGSAADDVERTLNLFLDSPQLDIPDQPWNSLHLTRKQEIFARLKRLKDAEDTPEDTKTAIDCIFKVLQIETQKILLNYAEAPLLPEGSQTDYSDVQKTAVCELYKDKNNIVEITAETERIIKAEIKIVRDDILKYKAELEPLTQALEELRGPLIELRTRAADTHARLLAQLNNIDPRPAAITFNNLATADVDGITDDRFRVFKQRLTEAKAAYAEVSRLLPEKEAEFHDLAIKTDAKQVQLDRYLAKHKLTTADQIEQYNDQAVKKAVKLLLAPNVIGTDGNVDKLLKSIYNENAQAQCLNKIPQDLLAGEVGSPERAMSREKIRTESEHIINNYLKAAVSKASVTVKNKLEFDSTSARDDGEPIVNDEQIQNHHLINELAELALQKNSYEQTRKIAKKEQEIVTTTLTAVDEKLTETIKEYNDLLDLGLEGGERGPHHLSNNYFNDVENQPVVVDGLDPARFDLFTEMRADGFEDSIKKEVKSNVHEFRKELHISGEDPTKYNYPEKTHDEYRIVSGARKLWRYYLPKFGRYMKNVLPRLATLVRSLATSFLTDPNLAQNSQFGNSQITSGASLHQNSYIENFGREFSPANKLENSRRSTRKTFEAGYISQYEKLQKKIIKAAEKRASFAAQNVIPRNNIADPRGGRGGVIEERIPLVRPNNEVEMEDITVINKRREQQPRLAPQNGGGGGGQQNRENRLEREIQINIIPPPLEEVRQENMENEAANLNESILSNRNG